ncbi:hypothetical protein J3E68DRAFT_383437 [Trichoderma sp. SZMC 28012]
MEDDPKALYTICCVVHHRNDILPERISPRELLQIAIEADKYVLRTALLFAKAQWLQRKNITDMMEMAYLMAVAFLFDDMDMFIEHSQALILQHQDSYRVLLFSPPHPITVRRSGSPCIYLLRHYTRPSTSQVRYHDGSLPR